MRTFGDPGHSAETRSQLMGLAKLIAVLAIGVFATQTLWWFDLGFPVADAMGMAGRAMVSELSDGLRDGLSELLDSGAVATRLELDAP